MIKVLVADDEKVIREGIGRYIKGMDGFKVCGICENGEAAFRAAGEVHPDLIITDVLMPKWDGIELIKRCREQDITCEFIIISGYSEFEYAKAAIKYGVLDYINKPINPENLQKSMEKAKKIIEGKIYVKKEIQEHFYDRVMEEKMHSHLEGKGYSGLQNVPHRVALLNLIDAGLDKTDFCEEVLKECLREEYICYEKNGMATLIMVGRDAESGRSEEVLRKVIEKGRKQGLTVYAGMGDAVGDMKGIPVSYRNAMAALWHGQINQSKICCYGTLSYRCGDSKQLFHREYLNMERLISTREEGKIRSYIQTVSQDYRHKFPPYVYYDFLLKCCELIWRSLSEAGGDRQEHEEMLARIHTAQDYDAAAEIFCKYVKLYCRHMEKAVIGSKGETFDEILAYIQLKYTQDLSVEQICKLFYMNESYFSSLFKNKMGCNYNEYVTDLRINKSKELLETGKYKVNEVADMAGYHSSRYFSKVFRAKTGVLPQEYRNRYLNKE